MSATGNKPDAGFTLAELLVTLAITAFVASALVAVWPKAQGGTASLQAAAQALAGDLRATRGRAIAENRVVRVDVPQRNLPAGVALAEASTTEIVFQRDGTTAGGTILLQAQSRRVAVQVERLSGQVRVVERP
jgi:general secretion pathway protein H